MREELNKQAIIEATMQIYVAQIQKESKKEGQKMISDKKLKFILEHPEGLTYTPCLHVATCRKCPYDSCLLPGEPCITEVNKDIVDALKELAWRRENEGKE